MFQSYLSKTLFFKWYLLTFCESYIGKCWLRIIRYFMPKRGYEMHQLYKLESVEHMRDSRVLGKNTDLWTRMPGSIIPAPPFIRVYPWGSCLICLCLSFFMCKMGVIIIILHRVITSIKQINTWKALKNHWRIMSTQQMSAIITM